MSNRPIQREGDASAVDRCSAVGMPDAKRFWFIAIVKNNTELSSQSKLKEKGYESYIPIQVRAVESSNGGKRKKTFVVIPTMIFIHCSEEERKNIVALPYINRFMVNRMGARDSFNRFPIAKIPTAQIDKLKFMVGNCNEDITIKPLSIRLGDEVEVIRGGLKGLVGNVEEINNETRIVIRIDAMGYAGVKINSSDIKVITHKR